MAQEHPQAVEFAAVVIPLVTSHAPMLGRTLLSTALTRVSLLAVLVGQKMALFLAVRDWPRSNSPSSAQEAAGRDPADSLVITLLRIAGHAILRFGGIHGSRGRRVRQTRLARERQHDITVLRWLVGAAQQVGHAPDEADLVAEPLDAHAVLYARGLLPLVVVRRRGAQS